MVTPERILNRVASRQHSVFTRAQALEAGFTPKMIWRRTQQRRWVPVHRGVYRLGGAPATFASKAMAACLATEGVSAFRTAAALWETPGGAKRPLEVVVRAGSKRRRPGVVAHCTARLLPGDVASIDHVPVTSPARTLLDLSRVLDPPRLEQAIDDVLARGLTTLDRLRARVDRAPLRGHRGVATFRTLLDRCDPVTAATGSHLEPSFRRLFERLGLPKPVAQPRIRLSTGDEVIPDFGFLDERVVVEIGSRRWHTGRAKTEADFRRENQLMLDGYRVVHFTAGDRRRPAYVRRVLLEALRRAG